MENAFLFGLINVAQHSKVYVNYHPDNDESVTDWLLEQKLIDDTGISAGGVKFYSLTKEGDAALTYLTKQLLDYIHL